MARNFIIAVALVAVVMAGSGEKNPDGKKEHKGLRGKFGGHGGPRGGHGGHGLPPFLANVSAEAKKAFGDVFRNENLTLAQLDTQVSALAEKYGVAAQFKEHQAKVVAHLAEVKKNTTAVITNLASVATQLSAIYEKKDLTRKAQHEAVEAIRKEHRLEVDAVKFIREHVGGHGKRHGGQRGKKGFGGRHGGRRGEQGKEGNPETKDIKKAN